MSRTRVKFCGVMRPADARAAADAGADAVGMILHADARRLIDPMTAASIVSVLPPYVSPVGVFVDAPVAQVRSLARFLNLGHVQLHGDETPEMVAELTDVRVVKVLKVTPTIAADLEPWRKAYEAGDLRNLIGLLLDSAGGGGTGHANDFGVIRTLMHDGHFDGLPPITVAGGLRPESVGGVVGDLRPFAVDTSSGIEVIFGEKSVDKMRRFIDAVRAADTTAGAKPQVDADERG